MAQDQQSCLDVETEGQGGQSLACSCTARMWQSRNLHPCVAVSRASTAPPTKQTKGDPTWVYLVETRVPHVGTEDFPGDWRAAMTLQRGCVCMCVCVFWSAHTSHQIIRGNQETGWEPLVSRLAKTRGCLPTTCPCSPLKAHQG